MTLLRSRSSPPFLLAVALAVWFFTLSAVAIPLKNIQFDRINITNEFGSSQGVGPINAIVQDQLGYMWFGGELGLVRYDAHGFVFYTADKNNPSALTSSFVRDLVVDHDGVMWVATSNGLNRYEYELDRFEPFYHMPDGSGILDNSTRDLAVDSGNRLYVATLKGLSVLDSTRENFTHYTMANGLTDNFIRTVYVDKSDNVWLGTASGGLNVINAESKEITSWRNVPGDSSSLPFDAVESIAQDKDGYIWVGTFGGGIARLNADKKTFTLYQQNANDGSAIGNNVIRRLYVDTDNHLWVGIDHKGLAVHNTDSDGFQHFTHSAYDNASISSNSIRSIYEDANGDMWIGTFPEGINYISRSKTAFHNIKHDPERPNSLPHNGVLALLKAKNGTIWIGTEGGLSTYHPLTEQFKHYQYSPERSTNLRSNAVVALEEDFNGDIWIGTWSGGLYRLDVQTEQFELFYPDRNIAGSINSPFIWTVELDHENTLWVGTEAGGLSRYDRENKKFIAYLNEPENPNSLSFNYVRTLLNDSRDRLWVGTLNGLNLMNKRTGEFKHYVHDPRDKHSLSSNRILALFEDSQQRIWVGSEEGGLNLLLNDNGEFQNFGVAQGLPGANVTSIVEDVRGYIWVSTSHGIASISPDAFAVQVYTVNDGIAGNIHNRNASMLDDTGRLFIGSTDGVTVFNPQQLQAQSSPPKIVINGLKILNRPVHAGDRDTKLSKVISATNSITLDYQDAMFSFDFATLSYRAPVLNQFAYKLEGFDKEWNYVGSMRTATYTNIDPGNYVFRVKGANSNGYWNEAGVSLQLTILPPPWRTWWAYMGYGFAFVAFLMGIINFKVKRIELDKERKVNAKLLRLDKLKDTFLANTSHELRTPLNGIVGISESLMDGIYGPINHVVAEKLRTIALSGRRLSALINDILDYSKLKEQKMQLHTRPVDLREVVDLVFALLLPLAQGKKINLINSVSSKLEKIEADSNRLQQILLNLIGNAIKYSDKANSYVRVFAESVDGWVKISIEDTGIGIPAEDLNLIFEAFNQVESLLPQNQEGTGLGLAVSKQLVENHGGVLNAHSKVGVGSTFCFTMPISQQVYANDPVSVSVESRVAESNDLKLVTSVTAEDIEFEYLLDVPKPEWSEHYTILIVDDDAVNRIVLQGILRLHNYTVIEAKDGYEALRILQQPNLRVDLLVLDISMPGIDGFEVCSRIRLDHDMYDLPIIFLSAHDLDRDVKQGFALGANDFVLKPVSKLQLLPRVENCLKQVRMIHDMREQLKEYMREALGEAI